MLEDSEHWISCGHISIRVRAKRLPLGALFSLVGIAIIMRLEYPRKGSLLFGYPHEGIVKRQ